MGAGAGAGVINFRIPGAGLGRILMSSRYRAEAGAESLLFRVHRAGAGPGLTKILPGPGPGSGQTRVHKKLRKLDSPKQN